MKTLKIISARKVKHQFVREGESLYWDRLKSVVTIRVIEPNKDLSHQRSDGEIKEIESSVVLKSIEAKDYFVALDERGETLSSEQFANFIRLHHENQNSALAFGIGGPLGWSVSARAAAQKVISLSPLTFPHELCRLIIAEQVFRAYSMILGLPYHREGSSRSR